MDKLRAWWGKNSGEIDKYFLGLKSQGSSTDPIERKVQDQYREPNRDNIDNDWAQNSAITGNYALLASPAVIEQNKSYDRDGFRGQSIDEKNDKADFRNKIHSSLEGAKKMGAEFFLRQFLVWFKDDGFSPTNYPEIVSWIYTAKAVAEKAKNKNADLSFRMPGKESDIVPVKSSYSKDDAKNLLYYLFKGNVLNARGYPPPVEFEKVLTFFVDYFASHLGEINDSVLESAFSPSDQAA